MEKNIFLIITLVILTSCEDVKTSVNPNNQESNQMKEENSTPKYLYKIVSLQDWEASQLGQTIVNSSMDSNFIHLATKDQLLPISQKFWNNQEYIILKLDSAKLKGDLIYEINPGGTTKYYHLYEGIIPLDAVVETSKKLPL